MRKTISYEGGDYTGEVNSYGEPHGLGEYCDPFNEVYLGRWKNGKKNGCFLIKGLARKLTNAVYEDDELVDSCRLDYDTVRDMIPDDAMWDDVNYDNAYYQGCVDWNDDPYGYGVMEYDDGGTYEGEWLEGKRDGWGIYTYPNGDKREGTWKNGKKEGDFTYTYANGDTEEEYFEDNEPV